MKCCKTIWAALLHMETVKSSHLKGILYQQFHHIKKQQTMNSTIFIHHHSTNSCKVKINVPILERFLKYKCKHDVKTGLAAISLLNAQPGKLIHFGHVPVNCNFTCSKGANYQICKQIL